MNINVVVSVGVIANREVGRGLSEAFIETSKPGVCLKSFLENLHPKRMGLKTDAVNNLTRATPRQKKTGKGGKTGARARREFLGTLTRHYAVCRRCGWVNITQSWVSGSRSIG